MKISRDKFNLKIILTSIFILLTTLTFALAQTADFDSNKNLKETADSITHNVLSSLGTLFITAAFVLFFAGVVVFIYGRVTGSGNMKDLEKGKSFMTWGLVALFVMVSVWGIIKLVQGTLGIDKTDIEITPVKFSQLDTSGGSGGGGTKPKPTVIVGLPEGTSIPEGGECQYGGVSESFKCQQGLSCKGSNGAILKDGQTGTCQKNGNLLQTDSGGTSRENPFTNTNSYPLLLPGDSSNSYALVKALNMAIQKDCAKSLPNGAKGLNFSTYNTTDVEMIKNFQRVNGLSVDGKIGKDTWEALSISTGQKTTFTGIVVKNCQ